MKFQMENQQLIINVENGDNLKDAIASVYKILFNKNIEDSSNQALNTNNVKDYLKEIGVPCHIKGYTYIQSAIEMFLGDNAETYKNCITKKLYPDIAKKYGTTSSRVERAIRHAIECAASSEYNSNLGVKTKLTNSEFLVFVSEKIENFHINLN